MLILSRKLEESIIIGDEIEIVVLEIKGDKVKIGVRAPAEIPVHRKEIYLAIKRENIEAAAIDAVELAKVSAFLAQKGKKSESPGTGS